MNKNEQNRVVAWRLKLPRQASDMPRNLARTCRHFRLSRKTILQMEARAAETPVPASRCAGPVGAASDHAASNWNAPKGSSGERAIDTDAGDVGTDTPRCDRNNSDIFKTTAACADLPQKGGT
jgi:hypothetical protein